MSNLRPKKVILATTIGVGILLAAAFSAPRLRGGSGPDLTAAPALVGSDWINVPKDVLDKVSSFKGHVTVLHFWTFECINCRHDLPSYAKWAANYKPDDVQVIGVHTPELPEERVPSNVRTAVKKLGITYPVLIDGDGTNWNHYHVEYWPTLFVIDKQGKLRYHWVGELGWNGQHGYAEVTRMIEQLRKE